MSDRRSQSFSRWCSICKGHRLMVGKGAKRGDKFFVCRVCDVREPDRQHPESSDERPGATER